MPQITALQLTRGGQDLHRLAEILCQLRNDLVAHHYQGYVPQDAEILQWAQKIPAYSLQLPWDQAALLLLLRMLRNIEFSLSPPQRGFALMALNRLRKTNALTSFTFKS
jgi:hypothetical protein